jgi:hypothetical protein
VPTEILPAVKPTLGWQATIDDMQDEDGWRYLPAYTDPNVENRYFTSWTGPNGERGFTLNSRLWGGNALDFQFGTHKIGDPQWRGRGVLLIDYDTARPFLTLKIRVNERHWQIGSREYDFEVSPRNSESDEMAWTTDRTPQGKPAFLHPLIHILDSVLS